MPACSAAAAGSCCSSTAPSHLPACLPARDIQPRTDASPLLGQLLGHPAAPKLRNVAAAAAATPAAAGGYGYGKRTPAPETRTLTFRDNQFYGCAYMSYGPQTVFFQ